MATKFTEAQVERLLERSGFAPGDSSTTSKVVPTEKVKFLVWPLTPTDSMMVPENEFYSLVAEAAAEVAKIADGRSDLVPTGSKVPDGYPVPFNAENEAFDMLHPDFLPPLLELCKKFIFNGDALDPEDFKANIGMTTAAGVMGPEGNQALFLCLMTAVMWTLHALVLCPEDEHVGWHPPADHASVYSKVNQQIKAQTRVSTNVLKGPDFAALAAKVKDANKLRLSSTAFPENAEGKSPLSAEALAAKIASVVSGKKWAEANTRNSSVEATLLEKARKLGQLTLQEAFAAARHLYVTRHQQMKVTKLLSGGGIKLSTQVAATHIETTADLREASTYLGRTFTEINREFGMTMRTEFVDGLLEAARTFNIPCAVLYGNMVLSNLHKFLKTRAEDWKREFPGSDCPADVLYSDIDFPLNEVLLSCAKRESDLFKKTQTASSGSSPARKNRAQSAAPRPPQHQLGADGRSSNPVATNARPRSTDEGSKAQACFQYQNSAPCKFYDRATGQCPYAHEGKQPSRAKPNNKGKKRKQSQGDAENVSSAEELDQ